MNAADDTRRLLKQRDRMLRDAFHGRNGLSMSDEQRAKYIETQERANFARMEERNRLAELRRRLG